jgi:two-component system nitrate/nitrite sensor histidine kinase NarX
LTKPIEVLVGATKKIRDGDLSVKTEIRSSDEIGQLGIAFDEMTIKLKKSYGVLETKIKERTRELEEERGSLEEKVQERTKELEDLKISLEKKNG